MKADFFAQLTPNSIVLTPNRRLSTHLLANYDAWQCTQGKQVWPTATILPLNTWLTMLWQTLPVTDILLSKTQELQLWQEIIERSTTAEQILDSTAAARLAQQAWSYLRQWQQPLAAIQEFANPEISVFTEWAICYQQRCAQKQLSDSFDVVDQLYQHREQLTLPAQIYLLGFDEIVPQTKHFLENLPCALEHIHSTQQASSRLLGLENNSIEIQTMLRWAQQLHQQQPQARITCVVPKLEQCRAEIVRQMHATFFPSALVDSEFTQDVVNISGGYPLQQAAIIKTALLLLQLTPQQVNYQALSELLTTPYIAGHETQLTQRALLDSYLRDLNEPNLTWHTVLNKIAEYQKDYPTLDAASFQASVENLITLHKNKPAKATHAYWREFFINVLACFDWPGSRNLSSQEYQQAKCFYEAIDEFTQFDALNNAVNRSQALKQLRQLIANTLFQPQTINGPIQILGLLEAAGLESDYIWVMGLDTLTWPAAANPNPFIPPHLQRQWQMPHSCAHRELDFALKLQQRFMNSCQQLIFSYPQQDGAQELQCSTLLKDIPEITLEQLILTDYQSIAEQIQNANAITTFSDAFGPALTKEDYVSGGASIFKAQAACPFQAFARHRLHAEGISTPEISLSHLDRGNLLHVTLENIWHVLGSQEKLLATPDDKLTHHIRHAVEKAFETTLPYYWQKIKPVFKQLEQQRLQQLILNWLNVEKQRPPFTVLSREQAHQFTFDNLTVKMRTDRIDQLANNQFLVIDYKSGAVSTKDWFDERPKEPQLPLYCVTSENIQAISFAEIKSDSCTFKGISSKDYHISGITLETEWQELVAHWHSAINNLADEFNSGLASVTPQPGACDYCELASLCRIHEVATCAS